MQRTAKTSNSTTGRFPRWGFVILAGGGLWASGLYAGLVRSGNSSTGDLVAAIGFGALGLAMLWGAVRGGR